MMGLYRTKEQRLIAKIQEWTQERLIGDDCAVLAGGQLLSMDTLVEGTHFLLPGISWEDMGWKSLAVNISDIAAMAGRPSYALVSLTLPQHVSEEQVERIYQGLTDCARAYRCRIVGGDLTAGPAVSISIAILGSTHVNGPLLRNGARPQYAIAATGDFGASAAFINLQDKSGLSADDRQYLKQRHCRPLPRLPESWALAKQTAGLAALMDASDGLADALAQIAAASNVQITVDEERIPVAQATRRAAARANASALDWALYGGEDYELVAALSSEDLQSLAQTCPNCFHYIGSVTSGAGVFLQRQDGTRQPITLEQTFQHWR